jgi:hypothetical protein
MADVIRRFESGTFYGGEPVFFRDEGEFGDALIGDARQDLAERGNFGGGVRGLGG